MKNVESFWTPKKRILKRSRFGFGGRINPIPRRNSMFGDYDRDGVANIFDCAPHNKRKQGWAHKGHQFNRERSSHVVMMTPQKFMRTTYRETMGRRRIQAATLGAEAEPQSMQEYSSKVIQPENVQRLKHVIRSRQGKMEIPFLEYDEQGRPTGHEGRHRATAAIEMGVKRIPVTVARQLKEPRDWENIRKTWGYKGTKHDWRNNLENVEEVVSSKSADIPIKEQREYGEEKPETLSKLFDKEEE